MKSGSAFTFVLVALLILTSHVGAQAIDSAYSFYPMHVGDIWEYHWGNWVANPPLHMYYQKKEIIFDTMMSNGMKYYAIQVTNLDTKRSYRIFQRIDSATAYVRQWIDSTREMSLYNLRSTSTFPETVLGVLTQVRAVGVTDAMCGLAFGIGIVAQQDYGSGWPYRSTLIYARINGKEYGIPLSVPTDLTRPNQFQLFQNYPNPFNPSTTIRFALAQSGFVILKVFNVLGQELRTIIYGHKSIGEHEILFKAGDLPSGVYFYRLQVDDYAVTKPMVLSK